MNNPRRVALVLPGANVGGSEKQALLLASGLRERPGWISGIATVGEGPLTEEAQVAGIPTIILPPFDSRFAMLRAWRHQQATKALAAFHPDVLLPFTWPANVFCARNRRAIGARVVCWNQRDEGLLRGSRLREGQALTAVDRFLANSPAAAAHLIKLGVDKKRIALIPNAVIATKSSQTANWRLKLGIPAEAPLVVMVANFTPAKDQVTAIRAWRLIIDTWETDAKPVLILAGRLGSQATSIGAFIKTIDLVHLVHCPGLVSDVASLLAEADLVVHASRSEGCPNAILEAMAIGCPVVASDLPGCRFALGDTGAFAAVGDENDHAQLILNLLRHPEQCRELGARAKVRAEAAFSLDTALNAVIAAIEGQTMPNNIA